MYVYFTAPDTPNETEVLNSQLYSHVVFKNVVLRMRIFSTSQSCLLIICCMKIENRFFFENCLWTVSSTVMLCSAFCSELIGVASIISMGWLRLVGSFKL